MGKFSGEVVGSESNSTVLINRVFARFQVTQRSEMFEGVQPDFHTLSTCYPDVNSNLFLVKVKYPAAELRGI